MDSKNGSRCVLLSSDKIPEPSVIVTCACDQNSEATFYCEQHFAVICQVCKTLEHKNCKTDTVKDKSADYGETEIKSLMERISKLKKQTENIIEKKWAHIELLATMKNDIKTEIHNFREEINQVLDRLESDTCAKFEKIQKEESKELNDDISTCKTLDKLIKADIDLIQGVMQTNTIEKLFAADVKVSNRVKSYNTSLKEVVDKNMPTKILFEKNVSLIEGLRKLEGIGKITDRNRKEVKSCEESPKIFNATASSWETEFKKSTQSQETQTEIKKSILRLRPELFNIRYPTEKKQNKTPVITGCAFMPGGNVVLCDSTNYAIIQLSCSFSFLNTMELTQQPFDISVINSHSAIVTCPHERQLQYVELEPGLKTNKDVKLDKKCWGIEIADNLVYITCHNEIRLGRRDGEIRIMDLDGQLIRRFGVKPDGSFMFLWPYYISVNPRSAKVFISDGRNDKITCLDSQGDVVYESIDHGLNSVRGMVVDDEDHIIVCDQKSSKVNILTDSGRAYYLIVTPSDGIGAPQSIAYRQNDNVVIIGSRDSNYVYIKRLNI